MARAQEWAVRGVYLAAVVVAGKILHTYPVLADVVKWVCSLGAFVDQCNAAGQRLEAAFARALY